MLESVAVFGCFPGVIRVLFPLLLDQVLQLGDFGVSVMPLDGTLFLQLDQCLELPLEVLVLLIDDPFHVTYLCFKPVLDVFKFTAEHDCVLKLLIICLFKHSFLSFTLLLEKLLLLVLNLSLLTEIIVINSGRISHRVVLRR